MTQNVLITGANRGIGLEFVRQYAASKAHVFACCRNPDQADELTRLAQDPAHHISLHRLDLEDFSSIDQLAAELHAQRLDLLIQNAGVYGRRNRDLGSTDYDDWMRTFRINTMAPFKLAESLVAPLSRGNHPILSVITSRMGSIDDNTSGGSVVYRSTKAALNMVAKTLSLDLAPYAIRVVALHPGWVKTDMGGANALISAEESVSGMRQVLASMGQKENGAFLAFDGRTIPW